MSARPSRRGDVTYESLFDNAALFEFSTVINSSLEHDFVFGHVLLTIMGKLLASKGMVLLACPASKNGYRVEAVKGFPASMVGTEIEIPRMPRTVTAVGSGRSRPWMARLDACGVRILLPLMMAGKPIGALGFGERYGNRPLLAREKTYLRSLANIAATAIEKWRTINELQLVNRKLDRKLQELNTLFDIGKEFLAQLDPDKLVRLLVYSLLGQIGANRYLVALKNGSDMHVVSSRLDGNIPQGELLTLLGTQKAAVTVDDLIVRSAVDPRPVLRAAGLRLIVPMQIGGEMKGVVLLGEKLSKEQYSEADREFVAALVNIAVISIENARLFQEALEKQRMEQDLMIARDIQKGLLPSVLPSLEGCDIAAANVSSKQVGGDYYDVIECAENRYVIAIGDVSGKGTPAALLMANIQATIRALVPLGLPLSELTARVNNLMCQNTGGSKFVTFFWGCLDVGAGVFRYVNAGHNYPYLLHADGGVERLEKGGMILGVMPTMIPYEEAAVMFRPGDVLVMFTDGVSEAMNRFSEEYGEERLEVVLREHMNSRASDIIAAVQKSVQEHVCGAPQSDDITMMVLKVASPARSS